jgi:leucyl-tRNA synthetase
LIVPETTSPFTGKGILINSGKYNGLTSEQAVDVFLQEAKAGGFGHDHSTYNLRDWLISRQRSMIRKIISPSTLLLSPSRNERLIRFPYSMNV